MLHGKAQARSSECLWSCRDMQPKPIQFIRRGAKGHPFRWGLVTERQFRLRCCRKIAPCCHSSPCRGVDASTRR